MSDRFKHLERGRDDAPAERPSGHDLSRFGAPAPVAAPASEAAPSAAQARFGPVAERLELEVMQDGEQPFLRCVACAHDNTRFVESCVKCGAALHTPAQRAFNEQLWRARLAESAAEAQAHTEHVAALQQATLGAAAARREQAMALAQRPLFWDDSSPAIQVLQRLPSRPARAAAVVAAFAVPFVLINLSIRHWVLQEVGGVLLAALVLSFLPMRR